MTDTLKPCLLPCPFCGTADIRQIIHDFGVGDCPIGYSIGCNICLAETAPAKTQDECFKAWNLRTPAPAPQEASYPVWQCMACGTETWGPDPYMKIDNDEGETDAVCRKCLAANELGTTGEHRAALSKQAPAAEPAIWPNIIAPAMYENPAEGWVDPKLPDFSKIWQTARKQGYSVGIHGSLKRDVDLIAVPWIENPSSVDDLVSALCEALDAVHVGNSEIKPCGRRAFNIQIRGYYKLIDLSVMPTDPAAMREGDLEALIAKAKEAPDPLDIPATQEFLVGLGSAFYFYASGLLRVGEG